MYYMMKQFPIFLPMQGLILQAITTNLLIIPFIMTYASIFLCMYPVVYMYWGVYAGIRRIPTSAVFFDSVYSPQRS